MKRTILSLSILSCLILGSCLSFTREFPAHSAVDPSSAYIFGRFTLTQDLPDRSMALNIQNVDNTNKYIIPFTSNNWDIHIYRIVPGTYIIDKALAISGSIVRTPNEIPLDALPFSGLISSFNAEPGTMIYIGDFEGTISRESSGGSMVTWEFTSIKNNFLESMTELLDQRSDFRILRARSLLAN